MLGNPNIEAARPSSRRNKAEAERADGNVLAIIAEIRWSGAKTRRAIADALNAQRPNPTRRGCWHAMSVRDVLARA
jgi:hypothetical protein